MKINNVELNKKKLWIPFLASFVTSFFVYYFGSAYFYFLGAQTISKSGRYSDLILFSLNPITFPFTIILVLIPTYFIIKRLLSEKPKRVFYLELPILIIIYSFFCIMHVLLGIAVSGSNLTNSNIINLMLFPIIFRVIWIFLLTIFSYYYYKKRFEFRNFA